MKRVLNYIDGQFCPTVTSQKIDVINPATEEVFAHIPHSNEQDVDKAVHAAKQAFGSWSTTSKKYRSDILHAIADKIQERFDAFAMMETTDNGKPLWLSKKVDIPRAVENFRFFADLILEDQHMNFEKKDFSISRAVRQPVGVAALITPWNLPIYLLSWKIAPALACGNTVVCKPSEVTPMTASLLAEVMDDISLPKGVCNFVFGDGAHVGAPMVSHDDVDLVSFTGGTQTGKKIQSLMAGSFKKTSFELGGKNPIIIDKDADMEKTLSWVIKSSFLNQGQICLCGERILIHQDIYQDFVDRFVEKTKAIVLGDPLDDATFMGPLVSKGHLSKVNDCVSSWKDAGAKVLTGDQGHGMDKGHFFKPVVMESGSKDHELHHQEIFGPVVTVEPFEDMKQAIQRVNASPYGLCASVFSQDMKNAQAIASKIDVATVWINCWLVRDLQVPFGGMKDSGMGREGGHYSLDFYSETKTICHQPV